MRRNLLSLANRIILELFQVGSGDLFAERLVLETKDGTQHGGWGLVSARDRVLQVLRQRPRKTLRRRRPR